MSIKADDYSLESSVQTEAEKAYETLKQRITSLELQPGVTVREADLQEDLGVRRTPLREALRRLANDGMVQIYPRHGIVVSTLGLADVSRIYEVRMVLERGTVALCAQRRTNSELAELQSYADELRTAQHAGDRARYNEAHPIFHRLIARYARNPTLEQYVHHALMMNSWLWNAFVAEHQEDKRDLSDHDEIMAAIAAGDPAAAERAIRAHIASSKEAMIAGL